jgi:hypothetical protein
LVKKLFALASISGLTGLLAVSAASGCSSTTTAAADGTDATTGGDTTKVVPKEAAAEDTSTGPAICPTTDPITAADIDSQLKWAPPKAPQAVCTQQNLDDLKALIIKNGAAGTKFTDIQTTLGATCAACAFSKDTDTNWQVYVQTTSGFLSNRTSSCAAQVEGEACGKAYFQADICLKIACSATDCGGDAEVAACQKKAAGTGGACNALGQAFINACPNEKTTFAADGPCASSPAAIAVTCGGGLDGGLDASLPP